MAETEVLDCHAEMFWGSLAQQMEHEGRTLNDVDGPWFWQPSDLWTVGAMGKGQAGELSLEHHMAVTVKPYQVAIWYKGWLWGLLTPFGGWVLEHPDPEGATLANLLAALGEQQGLKRLREALGC